MGHIQRVELMRLWTFLLDFIPTVIVTVAIMVWMAPSAGGWVGDFKPAAAPMVLTDARVVEDTIVFSGRTARLWPQCSPRRLEWFLGSRDGQNSPMIVRWGKPIMRPNGVFTFSGWIAETDDLEAFKFGSFSDVLHECRLFARHEIVSDKWVGGWKIPFLVRTKFYR